jgi:hypothetical protein
MSWRMYARSVKTKVKKMTGLHRFQNNQLQMTVVRQADIHIRAFVGHVSSVPHPRLESEQNLLTIGYA